MAEVVDVMEQYALEHLDVYFWFDLFTNDQNNVVDKDFDWFCKTFRGSIENIGEVLLVMSPWNDPTPIKRAWCLFEISSTLDMAATVKLTITSTSSGASSTLASTISIFNLSITFF